MRKPATIVQPLDSNDLRWIAERIHEQRDALSAHPQWECRLMDLLAVLVWSASVDGRAGNNVKKDGWIPSGKNLAAIHFERAPYTEKAFTALNNGQLTSIEREHVVPRDTLRAILLQTSTIEDSVRVLKEYSIVALVHESELKDIRPRSKMPDGWAANMNWSKTPLPTVLPTPWARYAPRIVPRHHDGRLAY